MVNVVPRFSESVTNLAEHRATSKVELARKFVESGPKLVELWAGCLGPIGHQVLQESSRTEAVHWRESAWIVVLPSFATMSETTCLGANKINMGVS